MFSRPGARHSQNAYVTSDLDRAMAIWRDEFGVSRFHVFENDAPGLVSSPEYRMKIALANVGGVEIELIEPLPGQAPLHAEVLPTDARPPTKRAPAVKVRCFRPRSETCRDVRSSAYTLISGT